MKKVMHGEITIYTTSYTLMINFNKVSMHYIPTTAT